jgi:hypothetical protein
MIGHVSLALLSELLVVWIRGNKKPPRPEGHEEATASTRGCPRLRKEEAGVDGSAPFLRHGPTIMTSPRHDGKSIGNGAS